MITKKKQNLPKTQKRSLTHIQQNTNGLQEYVFMSIFKQIKITGRW